MGNSHQPVNHRHPPDQSLTLYVIETALVTPVGQREVSLRLKIKNKTPSKTMGAAIFLKSASHYPKAALEQGIEGRTEHPGRS